MRVLIPCAGMATRWLGDRPKHLMPVLGEPILDRTVRLVLERRPDADVRIVVRDLSDDRYKLPGTKRATAKLDPSKSQADKFLSSRHLWAANDRTVILWGDVFFTVAAMDRILNFDGDWAMFARLGPSSWTGKDHKEPFAFSFTADAAPLLESGITACVEAAAAGTLTSWSGSWQVYRATVGRLDTRWPDLTVEDLAHVVEIDDWTDDFDFEDDWHRWCWEWAHANEAKRAAANMPAAVAVP